jgi:hypothetical protein
MSTPALFLDMWISVAEADLEGEFGPTARFLSPGIDVPNGDVAGGMCVVREEIEWLEHDGDGGVYCRFVGADEDTYLLDDSSARIGVWKVSVQ